MAQVVAQATRSSLEEEHHNGEERVKEFITIFIEKFEGKINEYVDEAKGERKNKIGRKTSTAVDVVNGASDGLDAVPMVGTASKVFISYPLCKIIEFFSARNHKKKAKKVTAATTSLQEDADESRRILAEAAYDIFRNFANQFIAVSDDLGNWKGEIHKLAVDAVNRAMNHYNEISERVELSSDSITKAVVLGKSKERVKITLKCFSDKSGRGVESEEGKKTIRTSKLYKKTGIVKSEKEVVHYHGRKGDDVETFGYRWAFEWEELEQKNGVIVKSPIGCKIFLMREHKETVLSDVLNKMDEKDPLKVSVEIRKEVVDTRKEVVDTRKEVADTRKEVVDTRKEVVDTREEVVDTRKEVVDTRKEVADTRKEVADTRKEVVDTRKEVADTRKEVVDIRKEVVDTRKAVERLENEQSYVHNTQKRNEEPVLFSLEDPVDSFTGRTEELQELHRLVQRSSGNVTVTSRLTTVTGLGGVGKTQLVKEYVRKYGEKYYKNILWMNSENCGTLERSFLLLATDRRLAIPTKDKNGKKIDIQVIVSDVYRFFKDETTLFVLDNAESYGNQQGNREGINEFLPRSLGAYASKISFVITSRNREWPGGVGRLELGVFTQKEAIALIAKKLEIEGNEDDTMKDLAETLQCFPLALQQAVSYITEENGIREMLGSNFTVANYLEQYKKNLEILLNFPLPPIHADRYFKTTCTTWTMTLDRIRHDSRGQRNTALEILDVIAYIAPDNIPVRMFKGLKDSIDDEKNLCRAVKQLLQYSMVTQGKNKEVLNVHRLVQEVTRLNIAKEKRSEAIMNAVTEMFEIIYPFERSKKENYSVMRELLPHLEAFLAHMDDGLVENRKDYSQIERDRIVKVLYWLRDGYVREPMRRVELLERVLNIQERCYGSDNIENVQTLMKLSEDYGPFRNFEKKKELLKRALAIQESHYDPDHIGAVPILERIANIYHLLGKDEKEKEFLERVLEISKRHYGFDHPEVAITLTHLARAYYDLGNTEKGNEFYERLLAIKESQRPDNSVVAIELTGLGRNYVFLENPEKGKELLERALAIVERDCDHEHPQLLHIITLSLGTAYGKLGNYCKAYELYERSSEMIDMKTSLHMAAEEGNFGTVEYILEKGADILARKAHFTVLHLAVLNSHLDVLRLILDKIKEKYPHDFSEHVNAKNTSGDTPLMFAAYYGKVDAAKILLEYGADILTRNNDHGTVLHSAVQSRHLDTLRLILDNIKEEYPHNFSEHVNAKDAQDDTPLMWVAKHGRVDAAKILLEYGADGNTRDNYDKTFIRLVSRALGE